MKSHKKEIITVAILMAAAVVIFAGILKPEATQTKKKKKNAPSFIFQRSGIIPMISGLR